MRPETPEVGKGNGMVRWMTDLMGDSLITFTFLLSFHSILVWASMRGWRGSVLCSLFWAIISLIQETKLTKYDHLHLDVLWGGHHAAGAIGIFSYLLASFQLYESLLHRPSQNPHPRSVHSLVFTSWLWYCSFYNIWVFPKIVVPPNHPF